MFSSAIVIQILGVVPLKQAVGGTYFPVRCCYTTAYKKGKT